MGEQNDAPKIQIDSDWKAEAQAEKDRLAQQADESNAAGTEKRVGGGQVPAANFETLISTMATQAMFALGVIPDPRTGQRVQHLDLARHHIDMLGVIDEKTKGNLSEEEEKLLSSTLYELRNNYMAVGSAARGR